MQITRRTIFSGMEQTFQKICFGGPKSSVKILFPWNKFPRNEIPVTDHLLD